MQPSLLLLFLFLISSGLILLACAEQNKDLWMEEGEIEFVDCFFDNYEREIAASRDYARSVTNADFSCDPARYRSFETFVDYLECKDEAATLYQSKYGDLNAEAIAAIETAMESLTKTVCWPEEDLDSLPYGSEEYLWMRPVDEAYVDCFFENYRNQIEEKDLRLTKDYIVASSFAQNGCSEGETRTYETYTDYLACEKEVGELFRSNYDGLSDQAIGALEVGVAGAMPWWVCRAEGSLQDLPGAP